MNSPGKRLTLLGTTAVILAGAVGVYLFVNPGKTPDQVRADENKKDGDKPMGDLARMWHTFGGTASRNMVNTTDANVPDDWTAGRKKEDWQNIKWVAKLGSKAYGGPVVAGGKIFVGTNNGSPRNKRDRNPMKINPTTKEPAPLDKGILMCFEEATGKFLWQHVNDKLESGLVNDWPLEGVCSTPVVEGDRVYYVSNRCTVNCLDVEGFANGNQGEEDEKYKDPTDADVIWHYDMMKELNVFPHNLAACSPLIVGDIIFIVTANGVDEEHIIIPSPNAPSFIALDKKTGKLLWKDNSPGNNIMHGQWSNPTYAEIGGQPQVIFPGGDGWLHAFEPKTGKKLWQFDCNPRKAPRYVLGGKGERSDFIATPVVFDGKIYIGLGQDPEHFTGISHLYCIDPAGKSGDISPELVTKDDPDPTKRETKPNPNSGQVWQYGGPNKDPNAVRDFVFGRTMSTVSIHDGLVYAAELDGYIHCLDAKTGQKYWDNDMKSAIWGSTMWVDGKVYVGTEDGDIYIYKHGKQKDLIRKIEMNEPVRSTAVVANGVLYIMTEFNLYAIKK